MDLTDAENVKKVVVDPLIAALRVEMRLTLRPLLDELATLRHHEREQDQRLERIEQRLSLIERFKMRIAAVCSAIAVVVGVVWRIALDLIRNRLNKGH